MNEIIKKISLSIDKSGWKPVTLGDVVQERRESCKDPLSNGIEHVVGLEHITPEDIHLRSHASVENETTFTKLFHKGDVLFGRRRAYLKKAAQAPFSGICSGDITVMRVKEGLREDLLPFLINNDKFFDFAVKHSAGGLSPRVKFKDLAKYEFLLPPKDEQARLAELLWAMDEVIEREKELLKKVETIKGSLFKKFNSQQENWTKYKIKDLMSLNYGSALKESDRIEGENYVVTSSGIQGTHNEYKTKGPGIVVGRKGNVGQVTWVDKNFWTTDTAYFIEINDIFSHIPLKFFYYLLIAANLKKHSIATAVPGLNRDDALLTNIYLPNELEIKSYLIKFNSLDESIVDVSGKISSSHSLQKSIINQIF